MLALREFYQNYSQNIEHIMFFSLLAFLGLLLIKKDWFLQQRVRFNPALYVFSVGLGLTWLLWIALYLIYPSYLTRVDGDTMSIGLVNFDGQPLYPSISQQPYFYGILYGPFEFWSAGLLPHLAMASGILAPTSALFVPLTKLPGIIACLLGVYAFYSSLRTIKINPAERLVFTVLLLLTFMSFGDMFFSNRGDSFIFALTAFGLWLALRGPALVNWILIGLVAGVATNFKLHAVLYLVPAAGIMLSYPAPHSRRLGNATLAAILCMAVIIAPLACDWQMGRSYFDYIRLGARHPLQWGDFSTSASFALSLALYVVLAYIFAKTRPDRASLVHWGFLLGAAIMALVPASKIGSGSHHLSPFIPYVVFEMARAMARRVDRTPDPVKQISTPFLVMTIYLALIFSPIFLHNLRLLVVYFKTERQHWQELIALSTKYPTAMLAPGSSEDFGNYLLNPVIVAKTKHLVIEAAAYQDIGLEHLPEAPLLAAIASCRVPQWIVAGGAPWSETGYYDLPVFSDTLRKTFWDTYRQIEQGTSYSVWQCKG